MTFECGDIVEISLPGDSVVVAGSWTDYVGKKGTVISDPLPQKFVGTVYKVSIKDDIVFIPARHLTYTGVNRNQMTHSRLDN